MVYEETVVLDMPFAEAVDAVKMAFAESGFGTLTEIDLQQTLHAKVGKEMEPYVIIGACNPELASAALDVAPLVGVLLPCNVVVREVAGRVYVDAMDPGLMASVTGSPALEPVAAEARKLVNEALRAIAANA